MISLAAALYGGVPSQAFTGGVFPRTRSADNTRNVAVNSPVKMVASPPQVHIRPGAGQVRRTVDPYNPDFHEATSFGDAYPQSTKEYQEVKHQETGHEMRVPFRRIHLSDPDPGCSHIDVYDTAGPLGVDPRMGLPRVRSQWIRRREESGDKVFTQMYYAKLGVITEEMAYVAAREGMDPEFVRYDVFMNFLPVMSTSEGEVSDRFTSAFSFYTL